nr:hypothetical protein [Providencia rettgeri]URQ57529.1 Hypothetical protein [Providencia alcalifaciens]URQ58030.1 Hypothetical protein [Providencia rettgeri]
MKAKSGLKNWLNIAVNHVLFRPRFVDEKGCFVIFEWL